MALVAHTIAASGGSGSVTTAAIDTTGATILVIALADYNHDTSTDTITDSKSNTWSRLANQGATQSNTSISYVANSPIVGANHTFTVTGGSAVVGIAVGAWNQSVGALDQNNGSFCNPCTTIQPGPVTPPSAELVVSAAYSQSAAAWSVDSAMVITDQLNITGTTFGLAWKTQTGTINPTWSGPTVGNGLAAVIASFTNPAPAWTPRPPPVYEETILL